MQPTTRLDDRNVERMLRLPAPREFARRIRASREARERVSGSREAIRDLLHGRDSTRLLVVAGPCSIHDADGARAYAERLLRVAERVRDRVVPVMRTYFEKPRTTLGWKGFLHDPDLDGSCDLATGLARARALLAELCEMGIACGSEALDPMTPQYLGDMLSWAAVGARTSESQIHRELASGLSTPVGFKNSTSGDVDAALNAMIAARSPHTFFGIDGDGLVSTVRTRGNPDVHVVLRGGQDGTNFDPAIVSRSAERSRAIGVERGVLIDCSHGNSGKSCERQPFVCRDVLAQVREGESGILGVMLESQLLSGRQTWREGVRPEPGRSITDECIGWDETEKLLFEIADAVDARA